MKDLDEHLFVCLGGSLFIKWIKRWHERAWIGPTLEVNLAQLHPSPTPFGLCDLPGPPLSVGQASGEQLEVAQWDSPEGRGARLYKMEHLHTVMVRVGPILYQLGFGSWNTLLDGSQAYLGACWLKPQTPKSQGSSCIGKQFVAQINLTAFRSKTS